MTEACFGTEPVQLRRLYALIRHLPGEGALYAVTHPDEQQGQPTYSAPAAPTRTVTSLRGLNLAELYASVEAN